MQYRARATIHAPVQRVWEILTDAPSWPAWEPNVTKVDGNIADGGKVTVHTKLSKQAFPVDVALDAPRRMTWTGGMPLGLFRGVRTFALSGDDGHVEIDVHEQFSGPLLFAMRRMMPDLQPSFDAFVASLKARAEQA